MLGDMAWGIPLSLVINTCKVLSSLKHATPNALVECHLGATNRSLWTTCWILWTIGRIGVGGVKVYGRRGKAWGWSWGSTSCTCKRIPESNGHWQRGSRSGLRLLYIDSTPMDWTISTMHPVPMSYHITPQYVREVSVILSIKGALTIGLIFRYALHQQQTNVWIPLTETSAHFHPYCLRSTLIPIAPASPGWSPLWSLY